MSKGTRTLLILLFISLLPLYIYVGDKDSDPAPPQISRQLRQVASAPTAVPSPTPSLEPVVPQEPTPTAEPPPPAPPTAPPIEPVPQTQDKPLAEVYLPPPTQQPVVQQVEPVVGVVVSEHMDIDRYCQDTYGDSYAFNIADFWECSGQPTTIVVNMNEAAQHNVDFYGLWVEGAPGYCAANLRGGNDGWGIVTCWP